MQHPQKLKIDGREKGLHSFLAVLVRGVSLGASIFCSQILQLLMRSDESADDVKSLWPL